MLWLQVWWSYRPSQIRWPSWEAAIWMGILMGCIGITLKWIVTARKNGLVMALSLVGFAGLCSVWTERLLPGSYANRFWMWGIWCGGSLMTMTLACMVTETAKASGRGMTTGLNSNQTSIARWLLLTTGLGILLSLGRYIPWSADVSLMALKFFFLPAVIWGWLTFRPPQRVFEAIGILLLTSILSAGWYSLWATSLTENLQLILLVTLQASFGIHASTRNSQSTIEISTEDNTIAEQPVETIPFQKPNA